MVAEESIHVSFKETNILDPRKDDEKIDTLLDTLKKINLDDLNKDREALQTLSIEKTDEC